MTDQYWQRFEHTATFVEPGKSRCEGVLEELRTDGPKDDPYPVLIIRTPKGWKLKVNVTQVRLLSELMRLRPRVGDSIAIIYTGDGKPVMGMSPPKEFDVTVTRANAEAAQ